MDSKYILLSADGPGFVYLVPSIVADNLEKYCLEFCNEWMVKSKEAERYRKGEPYFPDEVFISYLRKFKLIEGEYSFVEEIQDIWWDAELPEKYRNIPWFNF